VRERREEQRRASKSEEFTRREGEDRPSPTMPSPPEQPAEHERALSRPVLVLVLSCPVLLLCPRRVDNHVVVHRVCPCLGFACSFIFSQHAISFIFVRRRERGLGNNPYQQTRGRTVTSSDWLPASNALPGTCLWRGHEQKRVLWAFVSRECATRTN